MVKAREAVVRAVSDTETVKPKVPVCVGVPASVPVEASSVSPGGSEPDALQAYGGKPPVADSGAD